MAHEQVPEHSGAIVLDHDGDGSLIQSHEQGRDPILAIAHIATLILHAIAMVDVRHFLVVLKIVGVSIIPFNGFPQSVNSLAQMYCFLGKSPVKRF